MSMDYRHLSTGLPELDELFKGLIPGDNIVWNVEDLDDYRALAKPFCAWGVARGQVVTYFRFGHHAPLIEEQEAVTVCRLDPEAGFESFINAIHRTIEVNGNGGYYLFDCLTDLVDSWYSDEMLGNFFKLTCPYLLDVEALAYFALLKQHHSQNALQPIQQTTQIYVDVFHRPDAVFVHPIKVQHRYSSTMHMLHQWKKGRMDPVAQSGLTAEIYGSLSWVGASSASKVFDLWNQRFVEAEYVLSDPRGVDEQKAEQLFQSLLRMVITRDERVLELARTYLTLADVVAIGQRMIGTGLIGGKSVGMLLSQAVLRRTDPDWDAVLEQHDSFFIGSDVFYSYMVRNGCWWARQQKDLEAYLYNARHARRLILTGSFPPDMLEKFSEMLDYFGQAPILVRSSSLLEDNYGNAFSGKYESVFCPNQGSRKQCLDNLLSAIRTVYASAMSEKAIRYRARCHLLDQDEQMSLLIQRVSGRLSGAYHYPMLAGVAYSFNPYVWSEYIEASAGVLRLVYGLGTRAVDRSDDDYTCLVALNAPERRPSEGGAEQRRYTQRKVDVVDLQANRVLAVPYQKALEGGQIKEQELVASEDRELERMARETGQAVFSKVLTFDRLFKQTTFIPRMREAMRLLQAAYGCPVDVEFTANFDDADHYRIGLVQCRPFQVQSGNFNQEPVCDSATGSVILRTDGPVIGHGRSLDLDAVVYVEPETYGQLSEKRRYATARLVGKALKSEALRDKKVLLLGPGRWGTTTPSLGVPVAFADICRVSAICELVMMRSDLVPDVSLGTHFFNDLVECNILYLGLYPDRPGVEVDWNFLRTAPGLAIPEVDEFEDYAEVLRVIDCGENRLTLHANSLLQQVVCSLSGA